ncbi:glycosyltransferase [Metabacillus sp. GX 13764]|uniref:glycosyltransferase family protein n=1 Tax=Metabacillus kandeliae TaxID=2900151 RepID=UPI001E49252A|nr:glycosyltransferase [Metabacillus kandeliae]
MNILFLESHPMWIYGLPNGFKDAGHTAIISGPVSVENISPMIEETKPDLIVSMGWTEEHWEAKQVWIQSAVNKAMIPLVYWATEDPLHTENFTLPLISRMKPDFVFTVTPSLISMYEQQGIKAAHLDFGYHDSVHHQIPPLSNYRSDIAVVANAYPKFIKNHPDGFRSSSLQTLIKPLLQKGIRVDFWGKDWKQMGQYLGKEIPDDWIHGYLDYRDAYKVYSSAKIVIGLQNCEDQLTQRTYETLGSGGFLLTNDTPAVREKFIPDQDLIVSASPLETVQKVEYYLMNSIEREMIRERGQNSVTINSYQQRAEEMLRQLSNRGILKETPLSPEGGRWIDYETFKIHHVMPGESLLGISSKYNVPLQHLKKLNSLSSNMIYAGQIIKINEKKPAIIPRALNSWLRIANGFF